MCPREVKKIDLDGCIMQFANLSKYYSIFEVSTKANLVNVDMKSFLVKKNTVSKHLSKVGYTRNRERESKSKQTHGKGEQSKGNKVRGPTCMNMLLQSNMSSFHVWETYEIYSATQSKG